MRIGEDNAEDALNALTQATELKVGDDVYLPKYQVYGTLAYVDEGGYGGLIDLSYASRVKLHRNSDRVYLHADLHEMEPGREPMQEDAAEDAFNVSCKLEREAKLASIKVGMHVSYKDSPEYGSEIRTGTVIGISARTCGNNEWSDKLIDILPDASTTGRTQYDVAWICDDEVTPLDEAVVNEDNAEDALNALDSANEFQAGDRVVSNVAMGLVPTGSLGTVTRVTWIDQLDDSLPKVQMCNVAFDSGALYWAYATMLFSVVNEDKAEEAFQTLDNLREFEVGDNVEADLSYNKYHGKIIQVNANNWYYVAIDGNDEFWVFHRDELKLRQPGVTQEDQAEDALKALDDLHEFGVGDSVDLVDPSSGRCHKSYGKIHRVYHDGWYCVDILGSAWTFHKDELKLHHVNEDQAEDALSAYDGGDEIERISKIAEDNAEDALRALDSLPKEVGDKVILLKSLTGPYDLTGFRKGDMVTIVAVGPDNGYQDALTHDCIRTESGKSIWVPASYLGSLVREDEQYADAEAGDIDYKPTAADDAFQAYCDSKEFEVGDRVLVMDADSDNGTRVVAAGVVTSKFGSRLHRGQFIYKIKTDDGSMYGRTARSLEPAPVTEDNAEDAFDAYCCGKEFEVGDKVKVLDAGPDHDDELYGRSFAWLNGELTVAVGTVVEKYRSSLDPGSFMYRVRTRQGREFGRLAYNLEPVNEDQAEDALASYDQEAQQEFKVGDTVRLLEPSSIAGKTGTIIEISPALNHAGVTLYYARVSNNDGSYTQYAAFPFELELIVPLAEDAAEDALASLDRFDIGDRVRVACPKGTSIFYRRLIGEVGTIIDIGHIAVYPYAVQLDSGGHTVHFKGSELARVVDEDQAEDALNALDQSQSWVPGDRVSLVKGIVSHAGGELGTIMRLGDPARERYECHVKLDSNCYCSTLPCMFRELNRLVGVDEDQAEDALTALDRLHTFAPGDRVRIHKGILSHAGGERGTITYVRKRPGEFYDCQVKVVGGHPPYWPFMFQEIDLMVDVNEDDAEDALAAFDNNMPVGQRYRLVKNALSCMPMGTVVTLAEIDRKCAKDQLPLHVTDGRRWVWVNADWLAPIVDEDAAEDAFRVCLGMQAFEVGDAIRIKDDAVSDKSGQTGKITKIWNFKFSAYPYLIQFADGVDHVYKESEIERAPITEDDARDALRAYDQLKNFKVGDRVVVGNYHNNDKAYTGKVGTVIAVPDDRYDTYAVDLDFNKTRSYYFFAEELELEWPDDNP